MMTSWQCLAWMDLFFLCTHTSCSWRFSKSWWNLNGEGQQPHTELYANHLSHLFSLILALYLTFPHGYMEALSRCLFVLTWPNNNCGTSVKLTTLVGRRLRKLLVSGDPHFIIPFCMLTLLILCGIWWETSSSFPGCTLWTLSVCHCMQQNPRK